MEPKPADFITEAKYSETEIGLRFGQYMYYLYKLDEVSLQSMARKMRIGVEQLREQLQVYVAAAINEKIQREKAGISSFMPMPDGIKIFNGGHEPCDTLIGPCCCGGWHDIEWFLKKHEQYVRDLYLSLNTKK